MLFVLLMTSLDSIFYKGLFLFPHIVVYANRYVPFPRLIIHCLWYFLSSINDYTVPYLSAAIETEDPFLARHVNGLRVYVP